MHIHVFIYASKMASYHHHEPFTTNRRNRNQYREQSKTIILVYQQVYLILPQTNHFGTLFSIEPRFSTVCIHTASILYGGVVGIAGNTVMVPVCASSSHFVQSKTTSDQPSVPDQTTSCTIPITSGWRICMCI